jgi:hypothetical protein
LRNRAQYSGRNAKQHDRPFGVRIYKAAFSAKEYMKVNIELEVPTDMIVWQRPDTVKAACPSTDRLCVLLARGRFVGAAVYMNVPDEFWVGDGNPDEVQKIKPQEVDWWANLPIPPGLTEADPL